MRFKDANQALLAHEALESERKQLDNTFEIIERFVVPGRGRFFHDDYSGEESVNWAHRDIYDGTQYNAHEILTASIHGNLTSESLDLFDLTFDQDDLNDDKESMEWLDDSSDRVQKALKDSNFGLEVMEFYGDASGFGTSVMLHDSLGELDFEGFRFGTQMLRNCYFDEDFEGNPDYLSIKRTYSPIQLYSKFGEDLPQQILDKLENQATAIEPSEDLVRAIWAEKDLLEEADTSMLLAPEARPFRGRWILCTGREFVGPEEAWHEFPAYVLRWRKTAGSKYGTCPAMIALGDILTLQEQVQILRNAGEKTVDPPMKTTRRGLLSNLDQQAGGLTFVRNMDDLETLAPPGAYRVDVGWSDVNDIRRRIDRIFYVDQLELKESPQMTAYEVRVRYELMQRLLGPTMGRIQVDFLDKLVTNCFWQMYRKKALKPMPERVRQQKGTFKIEYKGPLARAQKMAEVDAIERWLATGAKLSEVPGAQEVADVPDYKEAFRHIGRILGVPEKLLRSPSDSDKRTQGRENMAKQAAQLQLVDSASSSAEKMARAQAAGNTGQPNG